MSIAIFSATTKLPSLAPPSPSHGKALFSQRPYLSLGFKKKLNYHLLVSSDSGSGAAVTVEDETPVSTEESVDSNGSPPAVPAAEVLAEVADVVASVNGFQDSRWVGGTWDLKQFAKDGKTDWDTVIDAGD